jgi:hypothetical protein
MDETIEDPRTGAGDEVSPDASDARTMGLSLDEP